MNQMKISLKIFIFTYCIMILVTVCGGFFFIAYEYENGLKEAKEQARRYNETIYTYIATVQELLDSERAMYSQEQMIERMSGETGREIYVGSYEELKEVILEAEAEKLENNQWKCMIKEGADGKYIQVLSRFDEQYIINDYSIADLITRRNDSYTLYKQIIVIVSALISVVLYFFAKYITSPIMAVTNMADSLSKGDYSVRIEADYHNMKSYEVEKLGRTLNLMAERTENYIRLIQEEADKKEAFMGNFAHEMKTPMTSIIGYADMLRSFDLSPEKRWEYSNFIYKEGRRVEQLSLNLLELIVLGKEEYQLKRVSSYAFFEQVKEEIRFLGEKYKLQIHLKYTQEELWIEEALLMTAVLNVIDNACKASDAGGDVYVFGKSRKEDYVIIVADRGKGIPKEELSKITEPFYMVDKSRARKQGGAGLGLSLCKKIMEIHGGRLQIQSEPGQGTLVTLQINTKKEEQHDEQ